MPVEFVKEFRWECSSCGSQVREPVETGTGTSSAQVPCYSDRYLPAGWEILRGGPVFGAKREVCGACAAALAQFFQHESRGADPAPSEEELRQVFGAVGTAVPQ